MHRLNLITKLLGNAPKGLDMQVLLQFGPIVEILNINCQMLKHVLIMYTLLHYKERKKYQAVDAGQSVITKKVTIEERKNRSSSVKNNIEVRHPSTWVKIWLHYENIIEYQSLIKLNLFELCS